MVGKGCVRFEWKPREGNRADAVAESQDESRFRTHLYGSARNTLCLKS